MDGPKTILRLFLFPNLRFSKSLRYYENGSRFYEDQHSALVVKLPIFLKKIIYHWSTKFKSKMPCIQVLTNSYMFLVAESEVRFGYGV